MSYLIYQHILKFCWVGWDGVGSGGEGGSGDVMCGWGGVLDRGGAG